MISMKLFIVDYGNAQGARAKPNFTSTAIATRAQKEAVAFRFLP